MQMKFNLFDKQSTKSLHETEQSYFGQETQTNSKLRRK